MINAERPGWVKLCPGSQQLHICFLLPLADAHGERILVLGTLQESLGSSSRVVSLKEILFAVVSGVFRQAIQSSLARAKTVLRAGWYPFVKFPHRWPTWFS